MFGLSFLDHILLIGGLLLGGGIVFLAFRAFANKAAPTRVTSDAIAERVRAVGKLVGLEVCAKEIATATTGWSWMPPLLLSQAKMAMIFHFERQYSIDLHDITDDHVTRHAPGRYRLRVPVIRGDLRLTNVEPYDIQSGRVFGVLDVIQMNAERQGELMRRAQDQAAQLFDKGEAKYIAEAQQSIERQLRTLFALFDAQVEFVWPDEPIERPRLRFVAA